MERERGGKGEREGWGDHLPYFHPTGFCLKYHRADNLQSAQCCCSPHPYHCFFHTDDPRGTEKPGEVIRKSGDGKPQRGQGAEPLVRGSGELKAFWPSDVQRTQQICTLGPLQYFQFKASYSNLKP